MSVGKLYFITNFSVLCKRISGAENKIDPFMEVPHICDIIRYTVPHNITEEDLVSDGFRSVNCRIHRGKQSSNF